METLIVDGYNIIYKVPELEKLLDKSLETARAGLEGMLERYRAKQRSVGRIYIVYDGKGDFCPDTKDKGLIHVTFTMKGQSGDEALAGVMNGLKNKRRAAVLSTDNFVTNHARATGVGILTLESFLDKVRPRRKAGEAHPRVHPEDADAINEELKRDWGV